MGETATNEAGALAIVERFNHAFNRHDVDAVMQMMTDDCVFDTTTPPPDGKRFVGQMEVRAAWEQFFAASPGASFTTEEIFACGNRCVVRWCYAWGTTPDAHVRGIDVFRVENGRVAEKLSYVKG